MTKIKRLYFDCETSPNVGTFWEAGWGKTISYHNILKERAIICICWKWEYEDKVHSVTWDKEHNDRDAVEKFIEVANKADEIIAHNGDKFDVKWLRTRALYHRLPCPPRYKTLDTLKKVRAFFKLNSNRLDYIAKLLGFEGKISTDPDLWTRVMDDERGALKDMVEYCKMDVIQLEKVFTTISPYINHNTHHGVAAGNERYSCPNCGGINVHINKTRYTAAGIMMREMKCKSCSKHYSISNAVYQNKLRDDDDAKNIV